MNKLFIFTPEQYKRLRQTHLTPAETEFHTVYRSMIDTLHRKDINDAEKWNIYQNLLYKYLTLARKDDDVVDGFTDGNRQQQRQQTTSSFAQPESYVRHGPIESQEYVDHDDDDDDDGDAARRHQSGPRGSPPSAPTAAAAAPPGLIQPHWRKKKRWSSSSSSSVLPTETENKTGRVQRAGPTITSSTAALQTTPILKRLRKRHKSTQTVDTDEREQDQELTEDEEEEEEKTTRKRRKRALTGKGILWSLY